MPILEQDVVVALDDVLAACATSADLHGWAGDHAEADALRAFAADTAAARRVALERLTEDMRAHDAAPRVPDPESAGFRAVMAGAKAIISSAADEQRGAAMVDALRNVERDLGEHVEAAGKHVLPDSTADALAALAEDVTTRMERLAGM